MILQATSFFFPIVEYVPKPLNAARVSILALRCRLIVMWQQLSKDANISLSGEDWDIGFHSAPSALSPGGRGRSQVRMFLGLLLSC